MATLNGNEERILIACKNAIVDATCCNFGMTEEVTSEGFSSSEIKGYLSQLQTKGLIKLWSEYGQIKMTVAGCDYLLARVMDSQIIEELNDIKANV